MAACLHSGVPEAPLHQVLRKSSPQENWIQAPARGLQQDLLLHQGYRSCSQMEGVLVMGGDSVSASASPEYFDPLTNTYSPGPTLNTPGAPKVCLKLWLCPTAVCLLLEVWI